MSKEKSKEKSGQESKEKSKLLKQNAFIALRIGYSRRAHAERLVRETNERIAAADAR